MDFLKPTIFKAIQFVPIIVLLMTVAVVSAQETLILATPVNGSVGAGESQAWTFNARTGEVLSFIVQAASESLDPVLTLSSSSDGVTLIRNDDYDYPASSDALLEAIMIPRTGTYTATVSAFGSTTGDYTLTMLPGYAQISGSENFNGANGWQTADDSALQTETLDGQLVLAMTGIGSEGVARDSSLEELADYYAQVRVTSVRGSVGWQVGMTLRQQNQENYYAVLVNSDGLWRFVVRTSQGETVLRDWGPHPAIGIGATSFTLGALVTGANFEFFYDGQYIGQVIDSTFSLGGQTGLFVGTGEVLDAEVRAQFDDLLFTTPFQTSSGGVFPQQLVGGSPQATVQELQRRRLIPTRGDMALTAGESFGQSVRPGVSRFPLGRGLTFGSFAYGATIDIQASSTGLAGCGLVFHNVNDNEYSIAYLDQTGGYGLSRRVNDEFQPGIFGQNPALSADAHDLLVIANGDILYYYIDGQHVGTLDTPVLEGSIGNAVVNFDPIDTTCQFTETWLWRWEG